MTNKKVMENLIGTIVAMKEIICEIGEPKQFSSLWCRRNYIIMTQYENVMELYGLSEYENAEIEEKVHIFITDMADCVLNSYITIDEATEMAHNSLSRFKVDLEIAYVPESFVDLNTYGSNEKAYEVMNKYAEEQGITKVLENGLFMVFEEQE
ncbi:hypothetical protein LLY41_14360 [Cytobacillus firmus]|uniref:hypothetical protein n=1 Tax=Cytobacillus firmus TaxID=1399 RepID=UPI002185F798|nr:hypothetical protein [Cytobacillus firmus]URM31601.1 hypothetical protein LLY41_14360 [Cytobacillus firmus]